MSVRFPAPPDEKCSESVWQKWVLGRAKAWGWATMHIYRAQLADGNWRTTCTAKGWPDLTFVRDGRLVFAELKDRRRVVEPDQEEWLDRLAEIEFAEVYVWRPADWADVVRVLAPA